MEPWVIGLIALIVVGLAVISFGALRDRQLNRRRAAEMLAPPSRTIPYLAADAAAPRYVSELQARRPTADAKDRSLTPEQRSSIKAELARPETLMIGAGYAGKAYITDPASGWAVLDQPVVVVCTDPVSTVRELLPILEQLIMDSRSFVLAAPSIGDEVRSTLEVNVIQRKINAVAVLVGADDLATIARATGAVPIDRGDRQSGYCDPAWLGRAERWVSAAGVSHVIRADVG